MLINNFITVKLKDLIGSELAIFHEDGLKLSEWLNDALINGANTSITIDFDGIERIGLAFLNASIGKHYLNPISLHFHIQYVKYINTNNIFEFDEKLKMVIENAIHQRNSIKIKRILNGEGGTGIFW